MVTRNILEDRYLVFSFGIIWLHLATIYLIGFITEPAVSMVEMGWPVRGSSAPRGPVIPSPPYLLNVQYRKIYKIDKARVLDIYALSSERLFLSPFKQTRHIHVSQRPAWKSNPRRNRLWQIFKWLQRHFRNDLVVQCSSSHNMYKLGKFVSKSRQQTTTLLNGNCFLPKC